MLERLSFGRPSFFSYLTFLSLGLMVTLAGCVQTETSTLDTTNAAKAGPASPPSPAWVNSPDTAAFSSDGTGLPLTVTSFCAALQWQETCLIPLYTDDGRLNAGNGTYGPIAYIAPSPALATLTTFTASGGVLVAYVYVAATGTLPVTYQNLQLSPGNNCVFLLQTGTNTTAYVTPGTSGSTPCPPTIAPSQTLTVKIAATPSGVNPSVSAPIKAVPPVARFHEGSLHGLNGQPYLGVKCGLLWCMIMPNGADSIPPIPHVGTHPTERWWRVHGWHDTQTLAQGGSGGTPLTYSQLRGSAVPGPAAELVTHPLNQFLHSVTVRIQGATQNTKYKTKWHFDPGENEIWIQKIDATHWSAQVRNNTQACSGGTGNLCPLKVEWVSHGTLPPATARFRWLDDDEGLWVRCDNGCCRIITY